MGIVVKGVSTSVMVVCDGDMIVVCSRKKIRHQRHEERNLICHRHFFFEP